MTKLILCLLLLFNIYNCADIKTLIFTKDDIKKAKNVKLGEEFGIKLENYEKQGYLWRFVNEVETKKYIRLLRQTTEKTKKLFFGETEYTVFYFKTIYPSTLPTPLKFCYNRKYTIVTGNNALVFDITIKY